MSDEEYEYEYGSEEDYQYGSGADDDDPKDDLIAIENAFYEGDELKTEKPTNALEQMVILHHRLQQMPQMLERYREMLGYVSRVTRNECTDSINQVLDTVSACTDLKSVGEVYRLTLGALKSGGNERLWFNTKAKLAKAYLQGGDFAAADHTIAELHRTCTGADGADDQSKGTYLLEVYGLIIQLCTATKDTARMREVYPRVMQLNAMYMATGQWSMAYNEFYEGFRNYQEAGNKRAKDCLKYVVLANMLALSDINPFAAREAKVYQEEKEVAAMMELRMAYETNDLARFEKTLQNKANRILDDNFIMAYVEPLKRRMREQVLLAIVRPYRRINLAFMARELNLPEPAVEGLLVELILDERLSGSIDQLQGFLQVGEDDADNSPKKYEALMGWSDELRKATTALTSRIALTADARG
ncbi:PCI domain-containing protein [Tribonema minus]|uniref:PCI domain-containing protein n=1 Tax=Tribonema minus TaxID=303371 RepID=A0A836CJA4_9STRA|nr:PCI domain-containing protein [Tribonema minus]